MDSRLRPPDYESGGREFESLRARHKPRKSQHNLRIAKAAMQNRKICMAMWQIRCNSGNTSRAETELAILFQPRFCIGKRRSDGLTLFTQSGSRKYLNAAERRRFAAAARHEPLKIRLFCLILRWTGARISEVLGLRDLSLCSRGHSVSTRGNGSTSTASPTRRTPTVSREVVTAAAILGIERPAVECSRHAASVRGH